MKPINLGPAPYLHGFRYAFIQDFRLPLQAGGGLVCAPTSTTLLTRVLFTESLDPIFSRLNRGLYEPLDNIGTNIKLAQGSRKKLFTKRRK